jgi:choline dehydrogenase-like flavoprotein
LDISADDGSIVVAAGQTWGGGGTVNWSASLQLQEYVRKEWASKGLPMFMSQDFQDSIDRVSEVMGVSADFINHSIPNQQLLTGAKKLNWAHKEVPQNTGHQVHDCGHCSLGCGSWQKQGPAVAWLPRAADADAKFIEGFDVQKIIFDKRVGRKRKAVGVLGTWMSRDEHGGVAGPPVTTRSLLIKAKRVIISCGTLQSPLLLLRSGIQNWHIGRHLYLHPVSLVGARYDQETQPWDGPILSSVVTEFENLDAHGHGVKLETVNMTPYSWLNWVPWASGLDFKCLAAKMRFMSGYISVCRDKDAGRVYPDPNDGRVRIEYHPSESDKNSILEGLVALSQINHAVGAREIFATIPGLASYTRNGSAPNDQELERETAAFKEWLAKLRAHKFPTPESLFVSAHQMGSCRMSAAPRNGVVDPKGRVWGTRGLYVIDASVFPSASGVNPFLTVMSIADQLSRGIVADWKHETNRKSARTSKI